MNIIAAADVASAFNARFRQVPLVQQMQQTECGAACLTMILRYYGKYVSLDEVRRVTGVGRDGASARTLLRAAESFGLTGEALRIELEDVAQLPRGCVLFWEFNHFVVFSRWAARYVEIVDPASGVRRVPIEQFSRAFTGVVILLEPGPSFQRQSGNSLRSLWRYVKHVLAEPGLIGKTAVVSVMIQLLAIAIPSLTGPLIDRVLPNGDQSFLWVLGLGFGAMAVFYFLSLFVRGHLLVQLRIIVDRRMTVGYMQHLIALPYSFFMGRSAGDLLTRANSNTTIRELLTSSMLSALLDGFLVTAYFFLIVKSNAAMGLLALGVAIFQGFASFVSRRPLRDLMAESIAAQAQSQGYLVQLLGGMENLKAAGAEHRALERWTELFTKEAAVSAARSRLTATSDALLGAIRTLSPFLLLGMGGLQVLNHQLSLGAMLSLQSLAGGFLSPLSMLLSTMFQFQMIQTYIERTRDVLDAPVEQESGHMGTAPHLQGQITLENVSFRYSLSSPHAISNVSVEIRPGQFVAIVGRSGSGKTTLGKLLIGLFAATGGRIRYDGMDLEGINLRSLRSQIGLVPQQPYLFGASIRSNIAFMDPNTSLDAVIRAAQLAQIHQDITAMPMGYETVLSDGGAALSGGQRQRLALARALVQAPSILLLDEATSALDTLTESMVQAALEALRCTRIVIAQRLSTVVRADLILVLDNGRIAERGTHEELLRQRGLYADMVAAQELLSGSGVRDAGRPRAV